MRHSRTAPGLTTVSRSSRPPFSRQMKCSRSDRWHCDKLHVASPSGRNGHCHVASQVRRSSLWSVWACCRVVSPLCEAMTMDSMSIHFNHGITSDGRYHPVTSPEVKELFVTGETPEVVTATAGDMAAADDIRLVLPETGVCSTSPDAIATTASSGCCGAPAPEKVDACCVLLTGRSRPARDRAADAARQRHPSVTRRRLQNLPAAAEVRACRTP
jgi:hypothetical protein